MYKLLGGLRDYIKTQEVVIDSAVFRMHNLFTTALLMACSLIITASQYVGNPIQCIVDGVERHVINTFCWISSTFTMPDAFRRQVGREVAHPGIDNDFGDEDAKKYYKYYQWVCFVLFFQGMACYLPKVLWDIFEGGLMRMISMRLKIGICKEEEKNMKKEIIIDYLINHQRHHNLYAIRYFACEFLCLLNVMAQLYLMNKFFDGEFLSYGLRVMNLSEQAQEDRVDPMVYVFPRVTKCIFHKYGASGSLQRHDSLCILPLNIVNEKTYIFIWFWFMILLGMLSVLVAYRAVILGVPSLRPKLMHASFRGIPIEVCRSLCSKIEVGDWWVLMMLGRNMDPMIYKEVVCELTKKIDAKPNNHQH